MKQWLVRFALAFQMMTRIPINKQFDVDEKDFGLCSVFFPFVGLLIGFVMMFCGYWVARIVNVDGVGAAAALVMAALLTGCLHIDGLGDTADGLLSGKDREGMLAIMKDSRIGTGACVAVLLSQLIKYSVLLEMIRYIPQDILMVPVAGRWAIVTAAAFSNYARPNGLGRHFIDHVGLPEWLAATGITLVMALLICGLRGAIVMVGVFLIGFLINKYIGHKLGGMTGDTLGAANEVGEMLMLAGLCVFL